MLQGVLAFIGAITIGSSKVAFVIKFRMKQIDLKFELFSNRHLAFGHLPVRRHDSTKRRQHEQPQPGNDAAAAESESEVGHAKNGLNKLS